MYTERNCVNWKDSERQQSRSKIRLNKPNGALIFVLIRAFGRSLCRFQYTENFDNGESEGDEFIRLELSLLNPGHDQETNGRFSNSFDSIA